MHVVLCCCSFRLTDLDICKKVKAPALITRNNYKTAKYKNFSGIRNKSYFSCFRADLLTSDIFPAINKTSLLAFNQSSDCSKCMMDGASTA